MNLDRPGRTRPDAQLTGNTLFRVKSHFHGLAIFNVQGIRRANGNTGAALGAFIPVNFYFLAQRLDLDPFVP